jgi:uncharacterized protein (DUF302 family)
MSRQSGVLVYYIVESDKSFYEATLDLEPVVQRHGLAVLHVHDLGEMLLGKGIDFDDECKLFEICNFRLMAQLLASDMRLSAALPWRISVFTDGGVTKIGLIRMAPMLAKTCGNAELLDGIEATLVRIIDETR